MSNNPLIWSNVLTEAQIYALGLDDVKTKAGPYVLQFPSLILLNKFYIKKITIHTGSKKELVSLFISENFKGL